MKKISEMTEDEVRDYALSLEQEKQSFTQKEKDYQAKIEEVTGLNTALQQRNNKLFMQLEQQGADDYDDQSADEEQEQKTETCEDFARRLIEGGN